MRFNGKKRQKKRLAIRVVASYFMATAFSFLLLSRLFRLMNTEFYVIKLYSNGENSFPWTQFFVMEASLISLLPILLSKRNAESNAVGHAICKAKLVFLMQRISTMFILWIQKHLKWSLRVLKRILNTNHILYAD